MDAIIDYISAHPAVITLLVIFVVIVLLYFVLKQFFKLLLVALFILMAVGGYYYFKEPNKTAQRIKKSIDTVQTGTDEITDKWKNFYRDTKELFNKGKKVPGDINRLLHESSEKMEK
jgi:energy-coupling factor transporter transmembrane protein EcfT